jgi:hypothetical protein
LKGKIGKKIVDKEVVVGHSSINPSSKMSLMGLTIRYYNGDV